MSRKLSQIHPSALVAGLVSASLVAGPFVSKANGAMESVVISSEDKIPSPRWMYGVGKPPHGNDTVSILAALKQSQYESDYKACASKAKGARSKAKSLQGWISAVEIDCASKMALDTSTGASSANHLAQALEVVHKNPEWMLTGPQAHPLRQAVVKGSLVSIERDMKTNRSRAWTTVERTQGLIPFMDERAKAKLWQLAGELAFASQKPEAARDLFRRSLRESDSEEVRARLSTIDAAILAVESTMGKTKKTELPSTAKTLESSANDSSLEASPEELALVDRVTTALKAGDLVGAAQDAAKLVHDFPGGTRAKWAADRIWDAYVSIADRTDPKYTILRDQIVRQMEKVDGDRTSEWARLMYNRGQYEDALALAKKSLENVTGVRSTRVYEIAAEAAIATDKFDVASQMLQALITQHAGTPSAREALLRMGLINYRLGKHAQAVAEFEKLLVLPQIENYDLTARHWLWRSLQKLKSPRAEQVADEMMQKFPFSYYGLRARLERNGNVIDLQPVIAAASQGKSLKVESQLWLTGAERVTWEKVQLLLKAGWLDEAQAELRELPQPLRAEDKAVRALLWAAAGQYVNSSKLANEAWDEKSELRRPPFIEASFPQAFESAITMQAANRKLDRYLVKGLIKQESGYNVRAISTSSAFGLMQLIGPTAKEVATDLKLGSVAIPDDLFVPEKNIQMGTYYISRMIAKYQGNVPLGLAAYNAGPARMDRWLRSRPSLKNVAALRSSAPDDELWFDEIPYSETSFYVKAILRNILLYRLLDQGRVEALNPVWAFDGGS